VVGFEDILTIETRSSIEPDGTRSTQKQQIRELYLVIKTLLFGVAEGEDIGRCSLNVRFESRHVGRVSMWRVEVVAVVRSV